jgi:short-subunit dehydrogenase
MARHLLITGASSGIGEAMARQAIGRGDVVTLAARRTDRLELLRDQCVAADASAASRIHLVTADVSTDNGRQLLIDVINRDDASPVTDLINNAGFGAFGRFWELTIEEQQNQLRTNVEGLMTLTHAALNRFVARGSGAVLNTSSVVSFLPWPRHAVYAASKAYVTSFTESVAEELQGTGVRIAALCPGPTRTEFSDHLGPRGMDVPGAMWMSADSVAAIGLKALDRGPVVVVTGVRNRLWLYPTRLIPPFIRRRLVGATTRRF